MTLSALGISKRVSELLNSHLNVDDLGLASTWHLRSIPSERFCNGFSPLPYCQVKFCKK